MVARATIPTRTAEITMIVLETVEIRVGA